MSFLRKIDRNTDLRTWAGEIPVQFRYTAGVAGETFLRRLKDEGKIYGTRCETCGITYVPARLFCERCFAELENWVDVGLEGEVYSYTIVHYDLEGQPLKKPRVFGLIKLYHADTLFYHEILAPPDQLRIGMKVVASLKPKNRRTGSITDIQGFEPKYKRG